MKDQGPKQIHVHTKLYKWNLFFLSKVKDLSFNTTKIIKLFKKKIRKMTGEFKDIEIRRNKGAISSSSIITSSS